MAGKNISVLSRVTMFKLNALVAGGAGQSFLLQINIVNNNVCIVHRCKNWRTLDSTIHSCGTLACGLSSLSSTISAAVVTHLEDILPRPVAGAKPPFQR